MMNALIVFTGFNLIVSLLLFVLWQRSQKQSRALQQETTGLQAASNALPADLDKLLGKQNKRVITVEILNPIELAVDKTFLAKPLIGLSPGTLNKIVYAEARDIIAKQLPGFGVKAEVKIHAS